MPLVKGRVSSGLGKGQVFLSQEGYQERLRKILGYSVFPGTLNIKVSLQEWHRLFEIARPEITSFIQQNRRCGAVKVLRVKMENELKGAALFPEKGIRPGVVELVSDRNLRAFFSLRDGDEFSFRDENGSDDQEKVSILPSHHPER